VHQDILKFSLMAPALNLQSTLTVSGTNPGSGLIMLSSSMMAIGCPTLDSVRELARNTPEQILTPISQGRTRCPARKRIMPLLGR
jgi:hypothetical protein